MKNSITIIDVGRGPQLSTSRITVQDVLPFFKEGAADEEILRWMPALSASELRVLEAYYRAHTEEVLALERRIEDRNALHRNSPEVTAILQEARAERLAILSRLVPAKNGESH